MGEPFNDIDNYGPDRWQLDHSPENAWRRLEAILNDKVMRFNPYLVDDDALLECAMRGQWRGFPALTQMVVFNFLDIRRVQGHPRTYDAIFFRVGNSAEEHSFPVGKFISGTTYKATRHTVRQMAGKQRITNRALVEGLPGKSYFVSHALKGLCWRGSDFGLAYRMHRLWGTPANKAKIIREAMIASKITMLEEVLEHPYNLDYLACPRRLIDYATIVRAAIDKVRLYPTTIYPTETDAQKRQ